MWLWAVSCALWKKHWGDIHPFIHSFVTGVDSLFICGFWFSIVLPCSVWTFHFPHYLVFNYFVSSFLRCFVHSFTATLRSLFTVHRSPFTVRSFAGKETLQTQCTVRKSKLNADVALPRPQRILHFRSTAQLSSHSLLFSVSLRQRALWK